MKKDRYMSFMIIAVLAVFLQSYFQQTSNFSDILGATIRFFIPVIWAIFLSILLYPLQNFLREKLHLNTVFSLCLVVVFLFAVLTLFMLTVIPQVGHSVRELQAIFPYMVERTQSFVTDILAGLHKKGLLLIDIQDIMEAISNYMEQNVEKIQKIGISIFLNVFSLTIGIGNFLIGLFLACLILLKPKVFTKLIEDTVYLMTGKEKREKVIELIWKAKDIFLNYVVGRLLVSVVVALIVFLILFFSKTPYPVLTALMFGIGNMIPYLGVMAASVISGFLVLIFAPYKIGYLLFAILLSQALDGFIIGPKIVGEKVGLSSFWVVVAILLCGKLMGIAGMFLGVPIFCILKLIYEEKLKAAKAEEQEEIQEKEGQENQ